MACRVAKMSRLLTRSASSSSRSLKEGLLVEIAVVTHLATPAHAVLAERRILLDSMTANAEGGARLLGQSDGHAHGMGQWGSLGLNLP
jgi:hypothetical protein